MYQPITITTKVIEPIKKVWNVWTSPQHIRKWNHASEEWHTVEAQNDLQIGGRFNYRMEAKEDDEGFNFEGTYTNIVIHKCIEYILDDKRKVKIEFEVADDYVLITETFDPETVNSLELQKSGWQAILNNFKNYCQKI